MKDFPIEYLGPHATRPPAAVFADPDDDRLSGPEKTSVFLPKRLDSLVRRNGTGIRPPLPPGECHGPLPRAAGIDRALRGSRGALPLPFPGFSAEGYQSHR